SISAETTFARDLASLEELRAELAPLCSTVARRLGQAGLAAGGGSLKLKTGDFKLRTRARQLVAPTPRTGGRFRTVAALLEREMEGALSRLSGVGAETRTTRELADPPDLFLQR